MKKTIAMLLACLMVAGLLAGCGAPPAEAPATQAPAAEKPAETQAAKAEDITLTVWGPQEDQATEDSFLQTAAAKFAEAHPEWNITWNFGVCSEGDAGKNVTQDPSAAADVYMFANDQLGTLIQANAIAKLGGATLEQIKADNSETMVQSVTAGDGVYGVPFTGNTWFMYYDKSVFTEEDVKSLDKMIEVASAAGKSIAFPMSNSWYVFSFYVANGGTLFGDGTDGAAGINFGGEAGTAATKCIVDLVGTGKFINDADGVGLDGLRNGTVAALFSGTWDAQAVSEALGENYGAAQLPMVKIGDADKQMVSFAGSKAIGVNPNAKNMKAAVAFAAWLGSAEMQKLHYEMRNIIPCALSLMDDPAIAADVAAVAQSNTIANTSILQPSIPEMGAFWTPTENMGKAIVNGDVTAANAAEKTEAFNGALNNKGL